MSTVSISRPNKALIIPGEHHWPNEIIGKLPDGRQVVPHSMNNTVLLRQAGYAVPHPMECYYGWPGDKVPYAIQRRSACSLAEHRRFYLINQQGTGKTPTTLWAWDFLRGQNEVGKLLVVGKLTTLNFVWAREVMRTLPHRNCVVLGDLKGMSRAQRLKALDDPNAEIFIINHDGLKVVEDELHTRTDIDCLVLDELAVYRNNSNRSKRMRGFAQRFKYVWGLTGSPMPNAVTDVWGQCKILTPHAVPKYFKACQEMLMYRINQFEWRPKKDAVERAFAMMQPSARYQLDDVLELPPITEETIDVELSEEQSKYYGAFKNELAIKVANKQITAANSGAALNKLLQIGGGWVYTVAPDFVRLDAGPRLNLLSDLVEANDRKVLIFTPYKHTVRGIGEFLNSEAGLGAGSCAVYDGDDQVLFQFQDTDRYKCLVSHPAPIGYGNTLTRANLIIWYQLIADYEVFEQASFRIRRISQEHKQRILYLSATSADRRFAAILRRKELTQDSFLALIEELTRE